MHVELFCKIMWWICSIQDCSDMWNVWHGSRIEKRLFGNKAEKQRLLDDLQGKLVGDLPRRFISMKRP